uniref:Uncharacterized protein n=1 Tax=Picea glauca TaxID=3330 RepID=A0A101LY84_PICGL|nr:hypothetical protein ABT39_MTgene5715 [Picea glauca]QHR90642.1 hypothetical protein Q903MT_gene4667 [Picea sitchensis]
MYGKEREITTYVLLGAKMKAGTGYQVAEVRAVTEPVNRYPVDDPYPVVYRVYPVPVLDRDLAFNLESIDPYAAD